MSSFEVKVNRFIQQHKLLKKYDKVLVGVSGGPDSLALLYFLYTVQEKYQLSITVAHVDHMFRGEESFAEMKYVEELCRKWKISFEGKQINVPVEVAVRKENSQSISRALRYEFYNEIMEKYNIPILALAHHGDDQIETILMRITRGTFIGAAAGIRVKRPFGKGNIIRPFLSVTKSEIEGYIKENKLQPVYDPSNQKDIYTRNRYRKYILPFLKNENQNVHHHFQQFSEDLTADHEYLMGLAKEKYQQLVKNLDNGDLSLIIDDFLQVPLPLQRRCIHLILNYLYREKSDNDLSSLHTRAILDLFNSKHPSGKLDLPHGLKVIRTYNQCIFTFHPTHSSSYYMIWERGESLKLPNGYQLEVVQEENVQVVGTDLFLLGPHTPFPIIVRSRKNGDRIQLKGTGGSKKLKSLFIDNKIPIHLRDEWPIVLDNQGNILWVPLLKKSKFEADLSEVKDCLLLHYKKTEVTQED